MTLATVGSPGGVTYVSLAFSPKLPPFSSPDQSFLRVMMVWLSTLPLRFVQVESNIWSINALVFLTCPIIW